MVGSGDADDLRDEQWGLPLWGVRVMLIEDEFDTLDLLTMILSLAGAVTAPHSAPGRLLEDWDTFDPHVLLSDIDMPGLDGRELLEHLVRRLGPRGREIRAIAMTASRSRHTRTRALEAGFARLITKPIDVDELIAAICLLVRPSADP